jgi:nicotinate dehydrogenase subunit A
MPFAKGGATSPRSRFRHCNRSNRLPPALVFRSGRAPRGFAHRRQARNEPGATDQARNERAIRRIPSSSAIQEDTALMAQKFTLNVNGKDHAVDVDPDMPLLYALRNDIGLNNPHFGCGLAQCGACTVHLDGQPIRSCVTPVSAVGKAKVVTLAGLGTPEQPHPLQTAYVEEQVPQCGYCINGWIMTAAAFLRDKKKPTDAEIKTALEGLKCRCGTHMGIIRAVKRASEMMG